MYMAETSIFEDDDMVFNKVDGKIQSAGFTVDSILMQKGEPALITRNTGGIQTGGRSVSDLFKDLAVPAGLAHFSRKQFGGDIAATKIQNNERDNIVSDDIYERLLKMVELEAGAKPRKTRRAPSATSSGKTKKHRIHS
jgi:hypothetical protein